MDNIAVVALRKVKVIEAANAVLHKKIDETNEAIKHINERMDKLEERVSCLETATTRS